MKYPPISVGKDKRSLAEKYKRQDRRILIKTVHGDVQCTVGSNERPCPADFCCVHDDFLFPDTICKRMGNTNSLCFTKLSDFECPCKPGLMCASNRAGQITSLFGRCYPNATTIAPNTIVTPSTSVIITNNSTASTTITTDRSSSTSPTTGSSTSSTTDSSTSSTTGSSTSSTTVSSTSSTTDSSTAYTTDSSTNTVSTTATTSTTSTTPSIVTKITTKMLSTSRTAPSFTRSSPSVGTGASRVTSPTTKPSAPTMTTTDNADTQSAPTTTLSSLSSISDLGHKNTGSLTMRTVAMDTSEIIETSTSERKTNRGLGNDRKSTMPAMKIWPVG
ncbi:uncharacterized protein LOC128237143 [Mya arenaria]|uniref:uncharacterized protein LOC128237143 n=1 Tax=Mya arenaria TaxID=6604 RepID=UPI0022E2B7B7|nr:uncharacterized protein LOC128237143 [Mya arenaria]